MLESVRRWQLTFTIVAITALMAMADSPELKDGGFESLEVIFTGGAPVAPPLSDRLEKVYGSYIHAAYRMSETASPITVGPRGERSSVDPESGSLSVRKAVYDTELQIVDQNGADLPDGEFLHTGDVAFRDAEGWIYLVDRVGILDEMPKTATGKIVQRMLRK